MSVLDRFFPKDNLIQKTVEIDSLLFDKVEYLSQNVYDASISKIINACIDELIFNKKIELYEKNKNEISLKHTIVIREISLKGLENLKENYDISINKLINIAIYKVLKEEKLI